MNAELEEDTEIKTSFLQKCMDQLSQNKNIIKVLNLIHSFFDLSEKKGLGQLRPHSSLFKGEMITINMVNDVNFGSDVPTKAEIKIFSNKTLFNLRLATAKEFKTTWERVKLMRQGKELPDSYNGKILSELKFRNGETLNVSFIDNPRQTSVLYQTFLMPHWLIKMEI